MTMRGLGILAVLATALTLVGCGDQAPGSGGADGVVLPLGEPTYDVDAPSWAVGNTIHVGEQEITVKPAPDAYVVATHGIYYVANQTLYFTDGGPVEMVGPIASSELVESAGGRYLGMMAEAESADEYGTAARVPVVFDLESGTEILHAEPGRVSGNDDLADLYEDAAVGFLGFAHEAAYVEDPLREGTTRFPLDGGRPEPVPTDDSGLPELPALAGRRGIEVALQPTESGGYAVSETGDGYSGVLSPDERYVFVDGDGNGAVFYDVDSGAAHRVDPGLRNFRLGGWVDDRTFYGVTGSGGGAELPAGWVRVVSCTTTGTCTPVSPEFRLPRNTYVLFGTGAGPYFY
jgi:hypothetical protein